MIIWYESGYKEGTNIFYNKVVKISPCCKIKWKYKGIDTQYRISLDVKHHVTLLHPRCLEEVIQLKYCPNCGKIVYVRKQRRKRIIEKGEQNNESIVGSTIHDNGLPCSKQE